MVTLARVSKAKCSNMDLSIGKYQIITICYQPRVPSSFKSPIEHVEKKTVNYVRLNSPTL